MSDIGGNLKLRSSQTAGRRKNKHYLLPKPYSHNPWYRKWGQIDRTANGRSVKILSIVDEFTRECLALEVSRKFKASDVIDVLADLFVIRGVPKHIRSDNGPEFVAKAIQDWLTRAGVEALYITPGSPWENGFVESFHSRLRDECLSLEVFDNVRHAQAIVASWRSDYNHRRPHSSLGYQTPAAFAVGCLASASATPALQPDSRSGEGQALSIPQPVLS